MEYRIEKDTLGEVKVPIDALWGPQTERSRQNFKIGPAASMPLEIIHAYALIKRAAAVVNVKNGLLNEEKAKMIIRVCDEVKNGDLDAHFPLVVWQTGSGTQTNMNLNEVIVNRAQQLIGKKLTEEKWIKANDDVNKSQSSNDTFPTAMHLAARIKVEELLKEVGQTISSLQNKIEAFNSVVKIGRTHLMDATPLTFGQEFSGYAQQIENGLCQLQTTLHRIEHLPIGGTAVGTGLNTPKNFDHDVVALLSSYTDLDFKVAKNKFAQLAGHDDLVAFHGVLKELAVSFSKIANDIRWMASGPRSGIGELKLPTNEPGSSIMPGKVNPTQIEALTMVCAQVIGNDHAITIGAMNGHFELNVYKPMIAYNVLQSLALLTDAIYSFNINCLQGIELKEQRVKQLLDQSLMLVTALNPHIGYYKAAEIANNAFKNGTTLKEEALNSGYVTEEEFDSWVNPNNMI